MGYDKALKGKVNSKKDSKLTGYSYGDDSKCPLCGTTGGLDHTIYETEFTRNIAMLFIEAIKKKHLELNLKFNTKKNIPTWNSTTLGKRLDFDKGELKGKKGVKSFMLGVLRGGNHVLCASSAKPPQGYIQAIPDMSNHITIVCWADFKRPVKNRADVTLDKKLLDEREIDNPIGQCAAQQLIARAIKEDLPWPWEMSELFYNPFKEGNSAYDHGCTIESCKTCKAFIPLMLCGKNQVL